MTALSNVQPLGPGLAKNICLWQPIAGRGSGLFGPSLIDFAL